MTMEGWSDGYSNQEARTVFQLRRHRRLAGRRADLQRCGPDSRTCALRTHDGNEVRFYDDLVKGRQVVINMMYANCEGLCPAITTRLVEVHRALALAHGP